MKFETVLNKAARVGLVAVAAIAVSAPAFAAASYKTVTIGGIETRTQNVAYGDLDLNSVAGRDAFKGRVKSAARSVCRSAGQAFYMEKACRDNTFRSAEPTMLAAIENVTGNQLAFNELR